MNKSSKININFELITDQKLVLLLFYFSYFTLILIMKESIFRAIEHILTKINIV